MAQNSAAAESVRKDRRGVGSFRMSPSFTCTGTSWCRTWRAGAASECRSCPRRLRAVARLGVRGALAVHGSPGACGQTTHLRALQHDLVDELHLLYPLLLGGGKRLFAEGVHPTFELTEAKPCPSGVVGLHYERNRVVSL